MFVKKMMIAAMASVFLIGTLPVEAASFGKSSSTSSSGSRSSSFNSGSSNRSSSFGSTPSRSPSSNSSTNSSSSSANKGSISQGSSLGMSRSNVANNVKNGNYSAPANGTTVAGSNPNSNNTNRGSSYGNNGNYNNGNYNNGNYNNGGYNNGYNGGYNQPNQGHSTGTVVGAAAAGALAGYALGNHNNNGTTVVVPNGNGGYNNGGAGYNNGTAYSNGSNNGAGNGGYVDNNGNYNTAPVGVAPVQSSSGGFGSFIWTLIKILVGLAILFFIVRLVMNLLNRRNATSGAGFSPLGGSAPVFNTKTPEDEIRDMKEDFFVQFQDNNRPSGLDHIRQNSTPVFYNAVEDMVRDQSENRTVKVRQLEAELVDLTQEGSRYIASVRYHAVVAESTNGGMQDSEVKELWNFVYENNRWKLAGIDQL